jgi:hypothetical protein
VVTVNDMTAITAMIYVLQEKKMTYWRAGFFTNKLGTTWNIDEIQTYPRWINA